MSNTDAKVLIDAIRDSNYDPSGWEMNFLNSIEEKVEDGMTLSKKQGDALQSIYRNSQGGGDYVKQNRTG